MANAAGIEPRCEINRRILGYVLVRLTIRILLFSQPFDLRDQLIDLFRRELSGKLGHVTFPVADNVSEIIAGRARYAFRSKRRPPKMSSRGGLSMTFCAMFLVNGIVS